MRRRCILLSLVLVTVFSVPAQEPLSYLALGILPGIGVPLGESVQYYKPGGMGGVSVAYKPPVGFPLYMNIDLGYGLSPFDVEAAKNLNLVKAGGGVGIDWLFLGRLGLNLFVRGGYYYGFTKDDAGEIVSGGNPYLWTGGDISFYLNPSVSIGVGTAYRKYFGKPKSVYTGLDVYLAAVFRVPISGDMALSSRSTFRPSQLKLEDVQTEGIFPVFYQYYDEHPIGKAALNNRESGTVEDIKVSVFIKGYMDSPKVYGVPGEIKKGEKQEIDLFALFNEKVLEITEGTKVAAEIDLEYRLKGETKTGKYYETLRLEHRNASIWDDDRRAAAFVTAKDPAVLRFAKGLAGMVRNSEVTALDQNMRIAVAVHEALSRYGVSYVIDPKTPYIEFVENRQAIDFLQFPRQTLEYMAGDCDDLSILYSAMLESVSVDTAFITVPGHIYIAVALDMTPEEVENTFSHTEDLIVRNGRVWLPLEVTEVRNSFQQAWETGARQWREYSPSGDAGFYPLAEAWNLFSPVGLPGESDLDFPPVEQIDEAYRNTMTVLLNREIQEKVEGLQSRISSTGGSPRLLNSLGVLYARYGLTDQAEEQFGRILQESEYTPALTNMGNIQYLRGDLAGAKEYYNRANEQSPDNPTILVNLTQVSRLLEERDRVKELFNRLLQIDPETAERFRFLISEDADTARAGEKEVLLWEE